MSLRFGTDNHLKVTDFNVHKMRIYFHLQLNDD
jgi:hypothetical protein